MPQPSNLECDGYLLQAELSLTMTLKIKLRSSNCNQPSIKVLCYIQAYFAEIPLTAQECTKASFNLVFYTQQWPWKQDQGHQNLINSSLCPYLKGG